MFKPETRLLYHKGKIIVSHCDCCESSANILWWLWNVGFSGQRKPEEKTLYYLCHTVSSLFCLLSFFTEWPTLHFRNQCNPWGGSCTQVTGHGETCVSYVEHRLRELGWKQVGYTKIDFCLFEWALICIHGRIQNDTSKRRKEICSSTECQCSVFLCFLSVSHEFPHFPYIFNA